MTNWVVITGASSGIGKALAMRFACENCRILAIGRNEFALQKLKNLSKNITIFTADLTDETVIPALMQNFQRGDKIEYLIHCAATSQPHRSLNQLNVTDFQNTIMLNATMPVYLTARLSLLFNDATRVLFMGSDYVKENGKIRPHISGAYAISKTALDKAVQYLRVENPTLAISYFNPGSTNTPLLHDMQSAVLRQHGIFNKESAKIAEPEDVAKFMFAILTQTTDSFYSAINWDYRNPLTMM